MQASGIRRIFIIAGITSLVVSYSGIWIRLINDPVEYTGSDFIHFYSAGRIAQEHGASHVYDLTLQQKVQQEQVGFSLAPGQVLPYNHVPFLIPILQSIVSANYIASFHRWVLLMIVVYVCSFIVLSRILKQAGIEDRSTWVAAAGGILLLPVFVSLMNGQDSAIVFLGATIWMYGLIFGQELIGGVGLSLTTIRPHMAIILALPMLFRHRTVFIGFVLGAGSLALLSVLIIGMDGVRDFVNILLISAGGEWYGIKQFAMYNLIGLLTRTIPEVEPDKIRLIGWVVYGVAIISLCVFWAKSKDLRSGQIGLTVVLALFTVPHLHFHDLTLLLIPLYEVILLSKNDERSKTETAMILPIAISLMLLLSNVSPILQYTVPYLIMAALVVYFIRLMSNPFTAPRRSSSPRR